MKRKVVPILILVTCVIMSSCGKEKPPTTIDTTNAVWLNLENAKDFYLAAQDIELGSVVLSPAVEKAMQNYPSNTVFAVAICFAAMVSEDKLSELSPSEEAKYLHEIFEKASAGCRDVGIRVDCPQGTCSQYMFFYAYTTEAQIKSLICSKDVALYVAATWQYK